MHGKTLTRRKQSPLHNGTHSSAVGINKNTQYDSMKKIVAFSEKKDITTPHIIMSVTSLELSLKQAYVENKPQIALREIINYIQQDREVLDKNESEFLRLELNKLRAKEVKMTKTEIDLLVKSLYPTRKTLPPVSTKLLFAV